MVRIHAKKGNKREEPFRLEKAKEYIFYGCLKYLAVCQRQSESVITNAFSKNIGRYSR